MSGYNRFKNQFQNRNNQKNGYQQNHFQQQQQQQQRTQAEIDRKVENDKLKMQLSEIAAQLALSEQQEEIMENEKIEDQAEDSADLHNMATDEIDEDSISSDEDSSELQNSEDTEVLQEIEQPADSEEEDSEEETEEQFFPSVPFSGVVQQSMVFIIDMTKPDFSENSSVWNYNNPFSKKGGYVREYVAEIAAYMMDLQDRNLMIVGNDFNKIALQFLQTYESKFNHVKDSMFGDSEASNLINVLLTVDDNFKVIEGQSHFKFESAFSVKMPALYDHKNEIVIRNLFAYFSKLRESLTGIDVTVIIAVSADDFIDGEKRSAFNILQEMKNDTVNNMQSLTRKTSNVLVEDYNLSSAMVKDIFDDYSVVFVQ